MDTSEPQDLHQPWLHQTVAIFHDSWNRGARRGRVQGVGSSSEGHDAPRFSSHRGATWNALDRSIASGRWTINKIETSSKPWSSLIRQSRSSAQLDIHRTADVLSRRTTIDARLWPDRGAIVANSAPIWEPRCCPKKSLP